MGRTSITQAQATALGQLVSSRRIELGWSIRKLASVSGVNVSTVLLLERGDNRTPQGDTLRALARALDIPASDLFTVVEWLPSGELPTVRPYLRAKYRELPEDAVTEIESLIDELARKHGLRGPIDDEDQDDH